MKGVILAGGQGTRLRPITRVTNKHMVPILNRPMILYPLETLKNYLGVTDILIVSGGEHVGDIAEFLGDGSEFGVTLTYRVQKEAGGIAQALKLAENFSRGEPVAVILGDNIFDNEALGAFTYTPWMAKFYIKAVEDPQRFGVIAKINNTYRIFEKPKERISDKAVTGLYIYPPEVFDILPTLLPSERGELEISDVNNYFLAADRFELSEVKGFWSDAGTPESLYRAIVWAQENSSKSA